MNRGFIKYYGEGMRTSFSQLRNFKNLMKIYAYGLVSLLGKAVGLIFYPLFALSDVRMGKILKNKEKISLSKALGGLDKPKNLWTSLLVDLVTLLVLALGVGFIFLLLYFAVTFYYYIAFACDLYVEYEVVSLITIPFYVLMGIFVIAVILHLAPRYYLIETVEDNDVSTTLEASYKSMKQGGKLTLFLNTFVTLLINALCIFLIMVIIQVIYAYGEDYTPYLVYPISLVLTLIYLYFAPKFYYAMVIANISLYEDILLDPYNVNKKTVGVRIIGAKNQKLTIDQYKDNLLRLFDETSDVEERAPKSLKNKKQENLQETNEPSLEATEEPQEEETPVVEETIAEPVVEEVPVIEEVKVEETPMTQETPVEPTIEEEPVEVLTEEPSQEVVEEAPVVEETPVEEPVQEVAEEPVVEEVKAEETPVEPEVSETPVEVVEEEAVKEVTPKKTTRKTTTKKTTKSKKEGE